MPFSVTWLCSNAWHTMRPDGECSTGDAEEYPLPGGEHMAVAFSRSMRSLQADGYRRLITGLVVAVLLLAGWLAWFFLAEVRVYVVSETARLEVERAAHAVEASVSGQVLATHMTVGKEVQVGDVLVELDAESLQLQLVEQRVQRDALTSQRDALRREIDAKKLASVEALRTGQLALEEERARYESVGAAAEFASERAERLRKLGEEGNASEDELQLATAEARKLASAAEAAQVAVNRVESEQETRAADRAAHIESLEREETRLVGEIATETASIDRLEHQIRIHHIRASIAGRLGDVSPLRPGAFVRSGERVASVVPLGGIQVVAHFWPRTALGRLQRGQPAQVRLDGFPWSQYGSLPAKVARVASEVREGRIRVELTVLPKPDSAIPLQHGLTGLVEVEVERVAPVTLVLRAAGQRFSGDKASSDTRGSLGHF
jgi:membrane fusion protein (multidrug efflux system)